MSEKSSGAKASKSGPSSDGKPADSKSTDGKATEGKPAASDKKPAKNGDAATGASESGADKAGESGTEKSQRQTTSSADVHYGYFSSVRTPAYRKGWDDIFGNKNSAGSGAGKTRPAARPKARAATNKKITLELDIAELPEELRAALSDEIRRKVKRRRIDFDKRNAAGAVRWNICCEIER